jgi:hypothetical protein
MVIIIGNYIDESVFGRRRLPFRNSAASNRIRRLAEAFGEIDNKVFVVSPGTALSAHLHERWWDAGTVQRRGRVVYITCPSITKPIVSELAAILFVSVLTLKLSKRGPKWLVMYCYYVNVLLPALFAKFFGSVPIVADIEDVADIPLQILKTSSGEEIARRLINHGLMIAATTICDRYITPASKFIREIKADKEVDVISGCISAQEVGSIPKVQTSKVVLMSGKIDDENGASVFLQSVETLCESGAMRGWEFHISGSGDSSWESLPRTLAQKLRHNGRVFMHGNLNNQSFKLLLARTAICVALQNPVGREANGKTPSKVYEALCLGKTVIVSALEEFDGIKLPHLVTLRSYTSDCLAEMLCFEATRFDESDAPYFSEKAMSLWGSKTVAIKMLQRHKQRII